MIKILRFKDKLEPSVKKYLFNDSLIPLISCPTYEKII